MSWRRPPDKRRRLSKPLGFSPFFRSLSRFSSAFPKPKVAESILPAKSPGKHLPHHPPPNAIDRPKSFDKEYKVEDEEEEEQAEETVQVDFGFFDPKPGDFHGAKLMLQNYLGDKPWDLSGFVDLILQQTTVGTVVKAESADSHDEEDEDSSEGGDEEGLYAVITALNLERYVSYRCIKEFKEFVLEVCGDEPLRNKLESLVRDNARDVGLLVCERFVNFPFQPVPPLYDALFDEVSWATEDEPTQEIQDSFRFKFYLLVTRIYMHKSANQLKRRAKASLTKKERNNESDGSVIYIKPEDEIFHELSSMSFSFHIRTDQVVPSELKEYREMGLVMVVESDKVPTFREKLKSLLAES